MSTRGFIAFVADGVEKIAYNHCDSYPEGLGLDTLRWLHGAAKDVPALWQQIADLRVLADGAMPTPEDVEQLKPFTNLRVSTRSTDDWYCLLRGTQGDPGAMLKAGVIEDGSDFPADSLMAEFGYVIDLDFQVFEAYRGFQKGPHTKGRFAKRPQHQHTPNYWPVALVASWPLAELPTDDAFVLAVEGDGGDQ